MKTEIKVALIGAVATLLVAIITYILAPIVTNVFTRNPTASSTTNPSSSTSPTPTTDGSAVSITTTSSSSIARQKTLTFNRQLLCIRDCNSAVIQITVISFTFDTARKQTSMLLQLQSQQGYGACSFTGLIDTLYFQDTAGETYQPGGQLEEGGSFSLVAGQPRQLTAIYSFLPSSGSTYTLLSSQIYCGGEDAIYGATHFTF